MEQAPSGVKTFPPDEDCETVLTTLVLLKFAPPCASIVPPTPAAWELLVAPDDTILNLLLFTEPDGAVIMLSRGADIMMELS